MSHGLFVSENPSDDVQSVHDVGCFTNATDRLRSEFCQHQYLQADEKMPPPASVHLWGLTLVSYSQLGSKPRWIQDFRQLVPPEEKLLEPVLLELRRLNAAGKSEEFSAQEQLLLKGGKVSPAEIMTIATERLGKTKVREITEGTAVLDLKRTLGSCALAECVSYFFDKSFFPGENSPWANLCDLTVGPLLALYGPQSFLCRTGAILIAHEAAKFWDHVQSDRKRIHSPSR